MHPETQSLLAIFAEVAIGTVALSGITMVLVMARQDPGERQTGLVAAQLAMAFAVVMASILPLVLGRYEIPETRIWTISSSAYAAIIVVLQTLRLMPGSGFPAVTGTAAVFASIPGASGLVLLIANLWIQADWPYLTQLLIALASSMVLYMHFVLNALAGERTPA